MFFRKWRQFKVHRKTERKRFPIYSLPWPMQSPSHYQHPPPECTWNLWIYIDSWLESPPKISRLYYSSPLVRYIVWVCTNVQCHISIIMGCFHCSQILCTLLLHPSHLHLPKDFVFLSYLFLTVEVIYTHSWKYTPIK